MLFPHPQKKNSKAKQNKIQSLSNLRYFWIAYRLCYDERCENEQCNIIDTKMLSTTIALYFNRVLNSKDIYCCARLKLCGRNSKSFCSSQGLSLFILPCRMRQIKETKALKHRKENAYSWEWLKLSIVSRTFRPTVVLWHSKEIWGRFIGLSVILTWIIWGSSH